MIESKLMSEFLEAHAQYFYSIGRKDEIMAMSNALMDTAAEVKGNAKIARKSMRRLAKEAGIKLEMIGIEDEINE